MNIDVYQSPWTSRYASPEMLKLFSDQHKYGLWRRLWLALATEQKALGLPITDEQLNQMKAHLDDIDFDEVRRQEALCHHDVMAHIHAFGIKCPDAKKIIHLGATSCYVTDNGDLLQYREGLSLIRKKLTLVIRQLASFAEEYADTPTLGLTHLQPAQVTTVGKRACLWLQDFLGDGLELRRCLEMLKLLGVKGAVGTQASFLALFNGDASKVRTLEAKVASHFGIHNLYSISGQTYPRKQDIAIAKSLSDIAVSAHKFATDVRLLASKGEVFEPFAERQVGSSAMPYKRNPVLCERVCGLARYAINLAHNTEMTAALQWMERSLDDSANRRLTMPELFLCTDAILGLLLHITKGLEVDNVVISRNLAEHAPFIATEAILMEAVRKGGDRQQLHEKLRQYSLDAAEAVRHGKPNQLLKQVADDSSFQLSANDVNTIAQSALSSGLATQQVRHFLRDSVTPFSSNSH